LKELQAGVSRSFKVNHNEPERILLKYYQLPIQTTEVVSLSDDHMGTEGWLLLLLNISLF